MGFWKAVAKGMLDKAAYEQASKQQDAYDRYQRYQPESFIASLFANRRASRWSDEYWRANAVIRQSERPLPFREDLRRCTDPNCGCGR